MGKVYVALGSWSGHWPTKTEKERDKSSSDVSGTKDTKEGSKLWVSLVYQTWDTYCAIIYRIRFIHIWFITKQHIWQLHNQFNRISSSVSATNITLHMYSVVTQYHFIIHIINTYVFYSLTSSFVYTIIITTQHAAVFRLLEEEKNHSNHTPCLDFAFIMPAIVPVHQSSFHDIQSTTSSASRTQIQTNRHITPSTPNCSGPQASPGSGTPESTAPTPSDRLLSIQVMSSRGIPRLPVGSEHPVLRPVAAPHAFQVWHLMLSEWLQSIQAMPCCGTPRLRNLPRHLQVASSKRPCTVSGTPQLWFGLKAANSSPVAAPHAFKVKPGTPRLPSPSHKRKICPAPHSLRHPTSPKSAQAPPIHVQ